MNKKTYKKHNGKKTINPLFIVLGIVLIVYSLIMIFMLLWGLNTSLKSDSDYFDLGNRLGFPNLSNEVFGSREEFLHFKNYKLVFENFKYGKTTGYYRGNNYIHGSTKTMFGLMMGVKDAEGLN